MTMTSLPPLAATHLAQALSPSSPVTPPPPPSAPPNVGMGSRRESRHVMTAIARTIEDVTRLVQGFWTGIRAIMRNRMFVRPFVGMG